MTREIVILTNDNFTYHSIYKRMLDCEDILSPYTDNKVSMKLIDENNYILMLIEASTQNYSHNAEHIYERGCFINRFEYVQSLIDTFIAEDFISSFITAVRYAMYPQEDGFLSRYNYIWAQTNTNEIPIIFNQLNPFEIIELGDTKTYIYHING